MPGLLAGTPFLGQVPAAWETPLGIAVPLLILATALLAVYRYVRRAHRATIFKAVLILDVTDERRHGLFASFPRGFGPALASQNHVAVFVQFGEDHGLQNAVGLDGPDEFREVIATHILTGLLGITNDVFERQSGLKTANVPAKGIKPKGCLAAGGALH